MRCETLRGPWLLALSIALMLAGLPAVAQDFGANLRATALRQFQDNLQAYLRLRNDLADKLKPLSSTPSAPELSARQESLAAAVRTTRNAARPGDIIPPAVAAVIRQAVAEDMRRRSADEKRGAFEEVPNGPIPRINQTYPQSAALPTVPPLLLASLPRLPEGLEYRFYARHVVILDGDAEVIIDYVADALPPR